jgi:hypothetical protein
LKWLCDSACFPAQAFKQTNAVVTGSVDESGALPGASITVTNNATVRAGSDEQRWIVHRAGYRAARYKVAAEMTIPDSVNTSVAGGIQQQRINFTLKIAQRTIIEVSTKRKTAAGTEFLCRRRASGREINRTSSR